MQKQLRLRHFDERKINILDATEAFLLAADKGTRIIFPGDAITMLFGLLWNSASTTDIVRRAYLCLRKIAEDQLTADTVLCVCVAVLLMSCCSPPTGVPKWRCS